ncbi:hypothetical protein ACQP2U_05145 [Nocardia sp. CA-084685]|uniref:hypothetical protein n=1 Tax=Nocardia sp. CA-084685 TaxID=3239970 RepID=UPI003D97C478
MEPIFFPDNHSFWYETLRTFGHISSASYLDYHVREGIAEKIACPTLVCAGADDGFFKGQPERLFAHLTCPKTLLEFTVEQGADAHCQSGAQRFAFARIYDWLDDTFDRA